MFYILSICYYLGILLNFLNCPFCSVLCSIKSSVFWTQEGREGEYLGTSLNALQRRAAFICVEVQQQFHYFGACPLSSLGVLCGQSSMGSTEWLRLQFRAESWAQGLTLCSRCWGHSSSTSCSWWRSSGKSPWRTWTMWFITWTARTGCWSSWWLCVWWPTVSQKPSLASGLSWAPSSSSSTPTTTCGCGPSWAGRVSSFAGMLWTRSNLCPWPRRSSWSSTMTSVPSATR